MINYPEIPLARTVRQVECISCQEKFAVSEEFIGRNHRTASSSLPNWHIVANHTPDTTLRRQDVRTRRPIQTPGRAEPNPGAPPPHNEDNNYSNYHLNCPRCGADNRNWIQITNRPRAQNILTRLFAGVDEHFGITISVFIAAVLSFMAFFFGYVRNPGGAFDRWIFLAFATFGSGLATALVLTQQWQNALKTYRKRRYLPDPTASDDNVWRALGLWFLFAIAVPLALYVVLPLVFRLVFQFELFGLTQQQILNLLVIWLGFVTLSCGIVAITTLGVIANFVSQIDANVPPPIFFSTAHMTRVVAWEAKHALEIRGAMEHIQWTRAERTEEGGIKLAGLHRDEPVFNAEGELDSRTVHAQHYYIVANRWGRIQEAYITESPDTPLAPGTPRFVVPNFARREWPVYEHMPLRPGNQS